MRVILEGRPIVLKTAVIPQSKFDHGLIPYVMLDFGSLRKHFFPIFISYISVVTIIFEWNPCWSDVARRVLSIENTS